MMLTFPKSQPYGAVEDWWVSGYQELRIVVMPDIKAWFWTNQHFAVRGIGNRPRNVKTFELPSRIALSIGSRAETPECPRDAGKWSPVEYRIDEVAEDEDLPNVGLKVVGKRWLGAVAAYVRLAERWPEPVDWFMPSDESKPGACVAKASGKLIACVMPQNEIYVRKWRRLDRKKAA